MLIHTKQYFFNHRNNNRSGIFYPKNKIFYLFLERKDKIISFALKKKF